MKRYRSLCSLGRLVHESHEPGKRIVVADQRGPFRIDPRHPSFCGAWNRDEIIVSLSQHKTLIAPQSGCRTDHQISVTHCLHEGFATTWIRDSAKLTVEILEAGVDSILPEVPDDHARIVDRQRVSGIRVRILNRCKCLRGNVVHEPAWSRISHHLTLI